MDLFRKCESLGNVRQAKEWGLYPYFHQMSSKQDTEVTMEGKKIVMIGSNNYLGLTSHPAVIAAGKEALDRYGTGCSGSRFLNGTLTEHVALERELADFLGKEDAVTFPPGSSPTSESSARWPAETTSSCATRKTMPVYTMPAG